MLLIGPRATVYNTKTNKVLLLQRNDGNNVWEIPGGKRENNEDIVDALKREVQTHSRTEAGRTQDRPNQG